jgi:hypothetical protein
MTQPEQNGHKHLVDADPPLILPAPSQYSMRRIEQADGSVIVRLTVVKPGHAITVDLSAKDAEGLEKRLYMCRTGVILPGFG